MQTFQGKKKRSGWVSGVGEVRPPALMCNRFVVKRIEVVGQLDAECLERMALPLALFW